MELVISGLVRFIPDRKVNRRQQKVKEGSIDFVGQQNDYGISSAS